MATTEPAALEETLERLYRLIQRGECVLFLGAGISADAGAPLSQPLADELGAQFLEAAPGQYDLASVSELIDAVEGRKTLNGWLEERFRDLAPSGAFSVIPLFRWKSIYTVNFDTLLEQAYQSVPERQQDLRPFYSSRDPLSRLAADEVPLYKLHGCLTRASSEEGHLTLTSEDLERVRETRMRLVSRLIDDTSDYTMLYVGFKRADSDFTRMLMTVEHAAGELLGLRRSYALQPGHNDFEARRWEQKRVTLIDLSATEFFARLIEAVEPEERFLAEPKESAPRYPLTERNPQISSDVLDDVARNHEIVDERVRLDEPDPDLFFKGSPPSWATIVSGADARRDVTDELLSELLVDPMLDRRTTQFVLLHSEAGAGKTTVIRRVGVDLALQWERIVVSLKPYGDLDFLDLEHLATQASERIFLIVDNATPVARELSDFLTAASAAKTKITVIAAARTNEWREIQSNFPFPAYTEFELESLSRGEIERILEKLEEHRALGLLAGASREAQVEAFETRARKQLLVALREATEGKNFDEIVVDEYDRIPTPDGQRAYLLVSALHRFGMVTRAGLLHRALDIPLAELSDRVFEPATKVIIPQRLQDDPEYYYGARHPLIAGIVFDRKIPSERRRFEFYTELIEQLDLGYSSDRTIHRQLTRGMNRALLRDFDNPSNRRFVMQELLNLDPSDAWAYQHAAMMELDLGNIEGASDYLRKAIELKPGDPIIRHTEGRIALRLAVAERDPLAADGRFGAAEDIFRRNINRRPQDSYAYRSLAETYFEWSKIHDTEEKRQRYVTLAYRTIVQGLDTCTSIAMLLQYQGELEAKLGNIDEAREAFAGALARSPGDLITRFIAARLEERQENPQRALEILEAGLDTSSDSPELHSRIAILMARVAPERDAEIRSHFEAAILGPIRNYLPRLAYGAYLFSRRMYQEAMDQFAKLDDLVVTSRERFDARRFPFENLGGIHTGRVARLTYDSGWVEYDQGAVRMFFRTRELGGTVRSALRPGDSVRFEIGFNLKGPIALRVAPAA